MIVVKIGGAAGIAYDALCDDIAALWSEGHPLVLVHGGSAATDALAAQLHQPTRTIVTPSGHVSRYTDRSTLEIFVMATARINRLLVEQLQRRGVNALGLSGIDGRLLVAKRKAALRSVEDGRVRIIRDDWTGSITAVSTQLLSSLIDNGFVPVIAPIALSERGETLNVDGDRAAAAIAGALGAETLLLLSNVCGLMQHFPDESSLVAHVPAARLDDAMQWAAGRMRKKVMAAQEALTATVPTIVIGDARREQPIQAALGGQGTTIGALPSWHAAMRVEVGA
jgi:acetylglutamate/LysW-gamma-L-alpha-aminoadipate kinase